LRSKLIREHRIFTGAASDKNVMRLLPALSLTKKQADVFLETITKKS
jgi:acetylornithine aminotransferase